MRANVLARSLAAAALCLPLLALVQSAPAQSAGRQMTAAQMITPADFTPTERDYYKTLDAAAAKNFIATRSYVRLCRLVLEHKLPALQLPEKPAGFTVKYLLPDDPSIINRALGHQLAAKQNPNHSALRAQHEMTAAQMLKPAELTAEELTYYKKLTDPAKAKSFIETRSYMRLAKNVVAHKMPAAQLPEQPLGFSLSYLLPGEKAVNDEAIKESLAALMKEKIR